MIKIKEKACKGTGKAVDFGCGNMTIFRKYGLCSSCYRSFLLNSDAGKDILSKTTLNAKKKVTDEKKRKNKEAKESIRTKGSYEKDLQTIINSIVRLIDHEKGCISCAHGWELPWTRQRHAGHRLSVGSSPTIRFNILNIYGQCSICNNWKSGNERNYDKGLIEHYGIEQLEIIKELKAIYPILKLTIPELKEAIIQAKNVKKRILNGEDLTREQINNEIGIYIQSRLII